MTKNSIINWLPKNYKLDLKIPEIYSQDKLSCYRRSAAIHKKVRSDVCNFLISNPDLTSIANFVEEKIKQYTSFDPANPLITGQAFPTGLSSGHIAAHYTPNPLISDMDSLKVSDGVLSIDFGVHTHGYLIDSAFTVNFDPIYYPLVEATKQATETGIKNAGPDAITSEIGGLICETMESYTVEGPEHYFTHRKGLNMVSGLKQVPVKVVRNLTGHSIDQYTVHAGKSVPCYDDKSCHRMIPGEIFAVETFGSTGRGMIENYGGSNECSHYMIKDESILNLIEVPKNTKDKIKNSGKNKNKKNTKTSLLRGKIRTLKSDSARNVLESVVNNFGGLAFCKRWLNEKVGKGARGWALGLRNLVNENIVEDYPPLADVKGSEVSQFEHTIYIKENGVEVLSRGDDY